MLNIDVIDVQILGKTALDALQDILEATDDIRSVLEQIGEDVAESTRQRFNTTLAPDGTPWAPNKPSTLERMGLAFGKSLRKKDGTLNKAGEERLASKKPLTGKTKTLGERIDYVLQGPDAVAIGSPMVYAAMQQFGGTRAEFPHLWGDIPARPFLGLSELDSANVLAILQAHLLRG